MTELKAHPLADLFPAMDDAAYAALRDDIRNHGLLEPVVTYRGSILDGRHRYRACCDLGIEPRTREFDGSDPLAFVVSTNLHRRHLNESQRAMVAAKIAHMKVGGDTRSDHCANLRNGLVTQTEAATLLNVSRRTVQHAVKVVQRGTPELVAAVDAGKISVSRAAKLAALPDAEQRKIVESIMSGKAPSAKKGKKKAKGVAVAATDPGVPGSGWSEVVGALARLAELVESAGPIKGEPKPWQLIEQLESTAQSLMGRAQKLRRGLS